MADPVIVPCPVGVWTPVAINKTTGVVHILKTDPDNYLQTYRDTGGAVPILISEGVSFNEPLVISASTILAFLISLLII